MGEPMIHAIRNELGEFDLGMGLLWLFCAPFFLLGWIGGYVVRCVQWGVAALVAGYKSGKG